MTHIDLGGQPRLAITGALLFDGNGAAPVPGATVLVDDEGIIAHAGTADSAPPFDADATVDLGGRALLPGFIDPYLHAAPSAGKHIDEQLRATLHAGITTARDFTGCPVDYRTAIVRGDVEGPWLHAADRFDAGVRDPERAPWAHEHSLRELGELVENGLSPLAAITRRTLGAAEMLGLCSAIGTLQPGKVADFVVSSVDPLADIAALGRPENIVAVAKSGLIVKDTENLFWAVRATVAS